MVPKESNINQSNGSFKAFPFSPLMSKSMLLITVNAIEKIGDFLVLELEVEEI